MGAQKLHYECSFFGPALEVFSPPLCDYQPNGNTFGSEVNCQYDHIPLNSGMELNSREINSRFSWKHLNVVVIYYCNFVTLL